LRKAAPTRPIRRLDRTIGFAADENVRIALADGFNQGDHVRIGRKVSEIARKDDALQGTKEAFGKLLEIR
jgi:hypothetical protein